MTTDPHAWAQVDAYFAEALLPTDDVLDGVLAASVAAGLPAINVSAAQGALLALLVRMSGASRVLEVGTLGAYSTIWMARALPADGHLVTLEADADHARVARANLAAAGLEEVVVLREGAALDTLPEVAADDGAPFDLVFIDADKSNNAAYASWALRLSHVGTVIVVDNVVRSGAVADPTAQGPDVIGVRQVTDLLAADPRVQATAIQTVGTKGWDGFLLAVVGEPAT